jgi:ABC-2 type transport system permease protein
MRRHAVTADTGTAGAGHGGVIHDIGYRRYEGPRLGRAAIVRALCWHSLRSAFGIGRGAKAKIVPVISFVIMCLPAVANAVGVAQGNPRGVDYDTYIFQLRVIVMIIFIAALAPELVSRDLRSHVLPLYFSRPLRRLDYPLAKLAAFILACLAMIEIPLLFLYLGTITQAHGGSAIWHETRALIPGLLVGLMWAVLLAAIGLVLASLSGRRAYSTGTIAIYFFLTWILAGILDSVSTGRGPVTGGVGAANTGARLSGLVSPFTVLDGVRQWLGGTSRGPIPPPGNYGPLYGAMLLLLLVAALTGLAVRYRKAGVA